MALKNSATQWGSLAKWLHWSIAILIIAALVCAIWADQLDPDIESHRPIWLWLILRLHKPIGFTALVLIVIRVAWTLANIRPALPASMTRHEILASKAVHVALYALMLIVPITGWFMSQYADSTINYFGLFEVPNVVDPSRENVGRLHPIHTRLGLVLAALVLLHIAAALYHEFRRKDGVLTAMLPGRKDTQSAD